MAVTVKSLQTADNIAKRFQIPLDVVRSAVDFLISAHLVKETNGRFEIGSYHIHLERESPLIGRNHMTWRVKAIENQDISAKEDLHYSSLVTFSLEDWRRIRDQVVSALEVIQGTILPSEGEDLFVMNMDLFRLKK